MRTQLFSFSLVVALFLSCDNSSKEQTTLLLKGSESMHETFNALKSDFEKYQSEIKVELRGGGSRTGMEAVYNDEAHIGLSSFGFDLDSIYGVGHGINQEVVAYDGILLISNMQNPIPQLSDQDVSKIFSGDYRNWSDVSKFSGPIRPIVRDQNSGTQKFFTDYYGIKEVTSSALIAQENSEIVSTISNDQYGIGFIGFAYYTENIHEIDLASSSEQQKQFVSPSFKNLREGTYPLKRSLMVYYKETADESVQTFLQYLKTERAQFVIRSHGLMPLSEL